MTNHEIVVDPAGQELKLIQQALNLRWVEFNSFLPFQEAKYVQPVGTSEAENAFPKPFGYPSDPVLGAGVDNGDSDWRIVHVCVWIHPVREAVLRSHLLTLFREKVRRIHGLHEHRGASLCSSSSDESGSMARADGRT